MVPRNVSEAIDVVMDKPAPELSIDWNKTNEWGIPESKVDYYRTLQQFGFFAVLKRENANPESFKGEQLVQKEADMNQKLLDDMATGLDFESVEGIFNGPAFDIGML
jgi:hypothetical protein